MIPVSELYALSNCAGLLAQFCLTYGADTADAACLTQIHHLLSEKHCAIPPALTLWHEQQGHAPDVSEGQSVRVDAHLMLRFTLPNSGNLSLTQALHTLGEVFDAKTPTITLGGTDETLIALDMSQLERLADHTIQATLQLHAQWTDTAVIDDANTLERLNHGLRYRALATNQPAWAITRLNLVAPL